MSSLYPYKPISPGVILRELLEERGWTQLDLADVIRKPVPAVNEIIKGKKRIVEDTALSLAVAFDTTPQYWLNLENLYRLDLVRKHEHADEAVSKRAKIYSLGPIRELLRRGWIEVKSAKDTAALEDAVKDFYCIESLDAKPTPSFAVEKGYAYEDHSKEQLAWVARAKQLARCQRTPRFSLSKLRALAPKLPKLSRGPLVHATRALHDVGVRVVTIENLTGSRIDGASLWLAASSPVIALSLRDDRIDAFWFTLMHEVAHVLQGASGTLGFIDVDLAWEDESETPVRSVLEEKADRLAWEWLISETDFERVARTKTWSAPLVYTVADALDIHPGIVVGRLKREGKISRNHLQKLQTPVREELAFSR